MRKGKEQTHICKLYNPQTSYKRYLGSTSQSEEISLIIRVQGGKLEKVGKLVLMAKFNPRSCEKIKGYIHKQFDCLPKPTFTLFKERQ